MKEIVTKIIVNWFVGVSGEKSTIYEVEVNNVKEILRSTNPKQCIVIYENNDRLYVNNVNQVFSKMVKEDSGDLPF